MNSLLLLPPFLTEEERSRRKEARKAFFFFFWSWREPACRRHGPEFRSGENNCGIASFPSPFRFSKEVGSIFVFGRDSNRRKGGFPRGKITAGADNWFYKFRFGGSVFHLFVNRPPSKNENRSRNRETLHGLEELYRFDESGNVRIFDG